MWEEFIEGLKIAGIILLIIVILIIIALATKSFKNIAEGTAALRSNKANNNNQTTAGLNPNTHANSGSKTNFINWPKRNNGNLNRIRDLK